MSALTIKMRGIALLSAVAAIGFYVPDVSAGCGDGTGCCAPTATTQTSRMTVPAARSAAVEARLADQEFQRLSDELNLDAASREKLAEIWERRNEQKREIMARHGVEVSWLDQMIKNAAPVADLNRQIAKVDSIEQELRNVEGAILNEIKLAIGVQKTAKFIVRQGTSGVSEEVGTPAEAFGGGLYRESEAQAGQAAPLTNPTAYYNPVAPMFERW